LQACLAVCDTFVRNVIRRTREVVDRSDGGAQMRRAEDGGDWKIFVVTDFGGMGGVVHRAPILPVRAQAK
jgi:hypothetical protein